MSCAIQNQLARILAEFEMTLERDVLQPLSRLSEVSLCPAPGPHLPRLLAPSSPSTLTPHAHPQEELPAILKHKKSLQKLVSDWNTLKSRWEPRPLRGLISGSAPRDGRRALRPWPHQEDAVGSAKYSVYTCACLVPRNTGGEGICEGVPVCVTAGAGATPKRRTAINSPAAVPVLGSAGWL